MPINCNRCDGSGFLNLHQIPDNDPVWLMANAYEQVDRFAMWIDQNDSHDVQVCDCCGNGEEHYGIPGEHYNDIDMCGTGGPYDYNGGLCECG